MDVHHTLVMHGQQIDETGLKLVRVLVFIHKDKLKIALIKFSG
jgi:hypothetical protein